MKVVRGVFLFLFVLLVFSQWALGEYFLSNAPRAADPARGAICPVRIHKVVVYITREESRYYNDTIVEVAFYCFAPVFIYEVLAQIARSKQKEDSEMEGTN
jgi:hypothetical protein